MLLAMADEHENRNQACSAVTRFAMQDGVAYPGCEDGGTSVAN